MIDGRVDDGMIEIGDPTEEPTAAEPPPRVVIEYRERGVPWMLIPPLIVLSAVGSMMAYQKFVPPSGRPHLTSVSKPPSTDEVVAPTSRPDPSSTTTTTPPTVATVNTAPVEKSVEPPAPPMKSEELPTIPPAATPASPFELPTEPPKPADPATLPRVQVGFDPKALEADRKPEATGDEAISPASKENRPDRPAQELDQPATPFEREQPTEVDPDLLPPDPRLARVRQQQRLAEAIRQIELDRVRFHADLKLVCKNFPDRGPRELKELFKRYSTQLEPASKALAIKLLGKSGQFAGADRATRIDVLRASGYPESVILDDIFISYEKSRIGTA